MRKNLLLLITAVLLSMANAYAQGGTTGPLTWNLNNGALTISGNGAMPDYEEKGAPWYDYREAIDTVIIVNGVTTIGNYAFLYCYNLYSVTIPTSVTSIGGSAFFYCEWLHLTTIPNSIKNIGSFAFAYCKALTSITIPNSITTIEEGTFQGCQALTSVTIPNSVKSIGVSAFYYCTSLVSITIPNSVTSIGEFAFSMCLHLNSISIPNTITNIADYLFDNCRSLTSFIIPNSVTRIGEFAFVACDSLASITIPKSVTSIGDFAFDYCTNLSLVTNLNPEPVKIWESVFDNVNISECTLEVPINAVSLYKKTNVWKEFKIEGIEVSITEPDLELFNLNIYPNPTSGELRIESGELRIEKVEIFDIHGKKVGDWHNNSKSENVINISHLSAGVYFVKINTEEGEIVKKVLKE